MNKLLFRAFFLLIVLFKLNDCLGQVKPLPEHDELSIPVFIHGINSKEDVERVQTILRTKSWTKFVQVECFPQKHTHLIIKNYITPEIINEVLQPQGYYVINKSFLDERDIEASIVESRKISEYKLELNIHSLELNHD